MTHFTQNLLVNICQKSLKNVKFDLTAHSNFNLGHAHISGNPVETC